MIQYRELHVDEINRELFYKAMGCTEAEEYCQKHVEAEPYDCQLECRLL